MGLAGALDRFPDCVGRQHDVGPHHDHGQQAERIDGRADVHVHQRAELDAPHEGAVRAPLVDQDVFASPLPNGRMPVADARIGKPDLGALAPPDDDRGRLERERKSRLLRLRPRANDYGDRHQTTH